MSEMKYYLLIIGVCIAFYAYIFLSANNII